MPVMDGIEATKQIRKSSKYANLPVVALTADIINREELKDYQMQSYIAKPIDFKKFYQVIIEILSDSGKSSKKVKKHNEVEMDGIEIIDETESRESKEDSHKTEKRQDDVEMDDIEMIDDIEIIDENDYETEESIDSDSDDVEVDDNSYETEENKDNVEAEESSYETSKSRNDILSHSALLICLSTGLMSRMD